MMTNKRHLPSIEALLDSDDELLIAELRAREVREHVAFARSLLDEIEELAPVSEGAPPSPDAAAQELAVLGCKIVELANALSRTNRNHMESKDIDESPDLSA